jgi:hypothetical protein
MGRYLTWQQDRLSEIGTIHKKKDHMVTQSIGGSLGKGSKVWEEWAKGSGTEYTEIKPMSHGINTDVRELKIELRYGQWQQS